MHGKNHHRLLTLQRLRSCGILPLQIELSRLWQAACEMNSLLSALTASCIAVALPKLSTCRTSNIPAFFSSAAWHSLRTPSESSLKFLNWGKVYIENCTKIKCIVVRKTHITPPCILLSPLISNKSLCFPNWTFNYAINSTAKQVKPPLRILIPARM